MMRYRQAACLTRYVTCAIVIIGWGWLMVNAPALRANSRDERADTEDALPDAPMSTIRTPSIKDKRGTFTLGLENDLFAGQDDGYTNGFRVAWLSPESSVPPWLENGAKWWPFWSDAGNMRYALELGQNMYAPENLGSRGLITDDRPYAGWLYGGIGLMNDTGYRLENLQLQVGVVGPSALGEPIQDAVHKVVDSPDPRGWDNQLRDEPGIVLTYERKWRSLYQFSPFGWGMDATPYLGGSLGNVFTHASSGVMFRLGYDLPADYGPPMIRPGMPGSDFFIPTRDVGWYVFAGVEGRAVARNIFLDGNSFRNSHHVDKIPLIGTVQGGAALTWTRYRLAYTHVLRSREFQEQNDPDMYGGISLSVRF